MGTVSGRCGGFATAVVNPNMDELIISHGRAAEPLLYENIGSTDLVIIKVSGPDINPEVPMIPWYAPG